jgi:hypothetical protein
LFTFKSTFISNVCLCRRRARCQQT